MIAMNGAIKRQGLAAAVSAFLGSINPIGCFRLPFSKRCKMPNGPSGRHKIKPLLFSLEADKRAARSVVQSLHLYAQECSFRSVSAVHYLVGKEVVPGLDDGSDPLRQLKLDAAIKIKLGDRGLAILPLEILAFSCVLANGRTLNIGLCKYPETATQPSSGQPINVYDPDYWGWQSSILTLAPRTGMDTCLETHMSVAGLLHYAEGLGALQECLDPTGYFNTNYKGGLEEACRQNSECGAC